MTRQQKFRMSKELIFNPISLAKKIHRQRRCLSCGAPVNVNKHTGKSVIYHFVKCMYPNTPWIEIERKEFLHECNIVKLCSYTTQHKIELMII